MANGFSPTEVEALQHIKDEVKRIFTYETDEHRWHLADYWSDDKMLLSAVKHNVAFSGDCEEAAMVSMRKAIDGNFKARLVVCLTEMKEGHCICEVVSTDGMEAYYFDNRRVGLATRSNLKDYLFYSVSPWNPQPGDQRPWLLVTQPST